MHEIDSFELAAKHASHHAQEVREGCQHQLGCRCQPPHWIRCTHMRVIEGVSYRCLAGDGHLGPHRFVDEAEHDSAGKAA